MTIAQALKMKNRLAQRIGELAGQIATSNVTMQGNNPVFIMADLLEEYRKVTEAMVNLKTQIQIANAPIIRGIYRMAELRGMIAIWKSLDTTAGKQRSYSDDNPVIYEAQIDKPTALTNQRRCERELDQLQAEIDAFNATTKIDFVCDVL